MLTHPQGVQWQPWGCMMHRYTRTDSQRCFRYNNFWGKKNHLVYVGDERVRQLYTATQRWLEAGLEPASVWEEVHKFGKDHSDLTWESGALNLRVDFIWAPVVNDSMTDALAKWRTGPGPTVLVLGAATTAIQASNGSEVALDEHRRNLTKLRPDLENMSEFGGTKVLWGLQPPVYWERLNGSARVLANSAIQQYNAESSRVFRNSLVTVWSSLARLGEGTLEEMEDGFHLSPLALAKATQMILNLVR